MYLAEKDMYPDVTRWWRNYLISYYRRSEVIVSNTSRTVLWKFLQDKGLSSYFKDYLSYEIQVDITGIIKTQKRVFLTFVECKLKPISLRDISQLLGYSVVARPLYSLIVSPRGISKSVNYLLTTFNRYDILKYGDNRSIRVANWNSQRKEIDLTTLIPSGPFVIMSAL